jgi:hypothetical protein
MSACRKPSQPDDYFRKVETCSWGYTAKIQVVFDRCTFVYFLNSFILPRFYFYLFSVRLEIQNKGMIIVHVSVICFAAVISCVNFINIFTLR